LSFRLWVEVMVIKKGALLKERRPLLVLVVRL
jgi:hypothetical protein